MHGDDVLRLGGVLLDLLSQSGDVIINRSSKGEVVIAPDFIQQLVARADEVLKLMNVKHGQVIVDIGAGSGYFTRRFAAAVGPTGKAIGVEIDSAMVRSLNADATRLGLTNYEVRLVEPADPLLAARSVDVIFLCDTYHHISERVAYFANVRQSLKPGGRLVIIDYVRTKERSEHSIVKEEAVDELRRAGFRLAKEFDLLLPRQYFLEFEPEPDHKLNE